MIEAHIQCIYGYLLTKKELYLLTLLMDPAGAEFANDNFSGQLRKDCVRIIAETPFLTNQHKDRAEYITKYINRQSKKGCFERV